jgi:hypothetical protein
MVERVCRCIMFVVEDEDENDIDCWRWWQYIWIVFFTEQHAMFNILIVDDLKVFGAKSLKQQHRSLLSLCVTG